MQEPNGSSVFFTPGGGPPPPACIAASRAECTLARYAVGATVQQTGANCCDLDHICLLLYKKAAGIAFGRVVGRGLF